MILEYNVDGSQTSVQFEVIGTEEDGTVLTNAMVYVIQYYAEQKLPATAIYNKPCPVAFPGGITGYDTQENFLAIYPDSLESENDFIRTFFVGEKPEYAYANDTHGELGFIGFRISYKTGDEEYVKDGGVYKWYYRVLTPVYTEEDGTMKHTEYPTA